MLTCNIELENYQQPYLPGQTILGRVECDFKKSQKVTEIYVEFKGSASVGWKEKWRILGRRGFQFDDAHFRADELYFQDKVNILPVTVDFNIPTIPAGIHIYPFEYILPEELPSTLLGANYSVSYEIKAVIVQPGHERHKVVKYFKVFSSVDLSLQQQLIEPIKSADITTVRCFCSSGTIEMITFLPKCGFAIGELFTLLCYISNSSKIDVRRVKIKILKVVQIKSHIPTINVKEIHTIMMSLEAKGVAAQTEDTIYIDMILDSTVEIPNLEKCSIIKTSYRIDIIGETNKQHDNVLCTLPVQFGHKLITDEGIIDRSINPSAPNESNELNALLLVPSYEESSADLPSYEEATHTSKK